MKIISYVTREMEEEGKKLQENLKKLNLDHFIEFYPSFGDKKRAKLFKPFFLENMRRLFKNETLCLVDGDSIFLDKIPEINIKKDLGLVLSGAERWQFWFSDAIHFHNPGEGEEEFIRVWKSLAKPDLIKRNNHPRILAAFYLSKGVTTFEFVDMKGSFTRNFGKKDEMRY